MTTREEALTRIRRSLQTGLLPVAPLARAAAATPEVDQVALLDRFVREAQANASEVFQPVTPAEVFTTLHDLIVSTDQQAITWADEDLPVPGLREFLMQAGVTRDIPELPVDPAQRRQRWQTLDPMRVGITGALAGVADTGSIVVQSGRYRSRAASLLPELHIALLPRNRLYSTMASFFAAHAAQELTTTSSNLVFITGPSRTADIEMILTHGVHGPKRLCVLLLPPFAPSA